MEMEELALSRGQLYHWKLFKSSAFRPHLHNDSYYQDWLFIALVDSILFNCCDDNSRLHIDAMQWKERMIEKSWKRIGGARLAAPRKMELHSIIDCTEPLMYSD